MASFQDDYFNAYTRSRKEFWDSIDIHVRSRASNYYHQRLKTIYKLNIPPHSTVLEVGCGQGDLLASINPSYGLGIDFSQSMIDSARLKYPDIDFRIADVHELDLEGKVFDIIILSDVINDLWDVQKTLEVLKKSSKSDTRIIFNLFSHLWQVPMQIAQKLGFAVPTLPQNWFTLHDLDNLLELSGFETLRSWPELIMPYPIPGANLINRYLSKMLPFRWFALTNFLVARPVITRTSELPTDVPRVSVVVAARNESGHIEELVERIPEMGSGTEIIFVEGNSTDDTYDKIKSVIADNPHRCCKLFKQPGKGKGDAVRTGFNEAQGEILMILDADITVPPEDLRKFYEVISSTKCEFVNGVRLVYPMQEEAMRFANQVGNKFFAEAFSWLLGQPIRDTLCGTKVLWKRDYLRIAKNRYYFGDFDPFGDFDLLFGAAKLNLKIMEIPIRYRARRYGDTNIERWKHGVLLLRMVIFAARKLKFV